MRRWTGVSGAAGSPSFTAAVDWDTLAAGTRYSTAVSPTTTRSPSRSRRRPVTRSPLTNVPFRDRPSSPTAPSPPIRPRPAGPPAPPDALELRGDARPLAVPGQRRVVVGAPADRDDPLVRRELVDHLPRVAVVEQEERDAAALGVEPRLDLGGRRAVGAAHVSRLHRGRARRGARARAGACPRRGSCAPPPRRTRRARAPP